MKKYFIPILLAANIFIITAINENYTAVIGFWPHVLSFFGFIALAFYARTAKTRLRMVLTFFSVFIIWNIAYHWLNQTLQTLAGLNFHQHPELYFQAPLELLEQAKQQSLFNGLNIIGLVLLLPNIFMILRRDELSLPVSIDDVGSPAVGAGPVPIHCVRAHLMREKYETPIITLLLATWLLTFPSLTSAYSQYTNNQNLERESSDSTLAQILKGYMQASAQTKMLRPARTRVAEGYGYFNVFKMDEKIAYYTTNCDTVQLDINFYLHTFAKDKTKLPKKRQKSGFESKALAFKKTGKQYQNYCYAEYPLPQYEITRYRTGQWSRDTKTLWSIDLRL